MGLREAELSYTEWIEALMRVAWAGRNGGSRDSSGGGGGESGTPGSRGSTRGGLTKGATMGKSMGKMSSVEAAAAAWPKGPSWQDHSSPPQPPQTTAAGSRLLSTPRRSR